MPPPAAQEQIPRRKSLRRQGRMTPGLLRLYRSGEESRGLQQITPQCGEQQEKKLIDYAEVIH